MVKFYYDLKWHFIRGYLCLFHMGYAILGVIQANAEKGCEY